MKTITSAVVQLVALVIAMGSAILLRYFNCASEYRFGAGLQEWGPGPFTFPLEIALSAAIYLGIVALAS